MGLQNGYLGSSCTGNLWDPGRVYGDQGQGTSSHPDIWDTPGSFKASLKEAIKKVRVKLRQMEEGMGSMGTPTKDSHPEEPLGLKGLSRRPPPWTSTSQGPPPWAPPHPGETLRHPIWAGQGLSPDSSSQ